MPRTAPFWLTLSVLTLTGCSNDPFRVDGEPTCRQRDNLITCVDKDEYVQGQTVKWEVRSARADTVFFDVCSTELVSDFGSGFFDEYRPQVLCGAGANRETVRENMVPIFPGDVYTGETELFILIPQGRYRMNLWIVTETGKRLSLGPYFSTNFSIFPKRNE